jgi:hypothetical protein
MWIVVDYLTDPAEVQRQASKFQWVEPDESELRGGIEFATGTFASENRMSTLKKFDP